MKKVFIHLFALFTLIMMVATFVPRPASAATAADFQKATVSFTFDDGFESTYTEALPVLSARNIPATVYITAGFIDNGVTDDANLPAMTWAQVQALQNTYGWEIGGHTQTHPELPLLTKEQIAQEMATSNTELADHGLTVTNFATPFGAYDNTVLTEALKVYNSHRGFADRDTMNAFPYNKAVLTVQSVESVTTVAQVQAWVDQAKANNQWLILVFHHIADELDPNYEYTNTTADLATIADYVKNSGVQIKTVEQASKTPGANVLTNSSFEDGLSNGWTTNNAAQVTVDSGNNGNYPTPNNSIKMTGSTVASHLFSSLVNVVPGADYILEAFVNTTGLTAGEFGFYMDEYDANNNWISGQWLGLVANNTVGFFEKVYRATSTAVAKVGVQTYLTANATGSVVTDNVKLNDLSLDGITPTPTPTGTVSPTPTPTGGAGGTNLLPNSTFDNGVSQGWTTDNATQVKADSGNHGATPSSQNSVSFTGGVNSAHLFFAPLTVNSAAQYAFEAFVNATGLTAGELGFYIDEYDSNNTWISGKWLGNVLPGSTTTFSKIYQATSAAVNNIRIQTYIFKGSTGTAYTDEYKFVDTSAPTGSPAPTPSGTPTGTPSVTPTGTPSVTPTPTVPTGTNVVLNPSFETLLSGWASNWERDNTDFTIDTTSKGDNGANSLHIGPNVAYAHAFSDKIAIDAASTYTWSQFVSILSGAGEFGFYIDEYDANDVWISGQWKGMLNGVFSGLKQFTYVPTSANVKKVRLQYYSVPNSSFNLYLDSVNLSK